MNEEKNDLLFSPLFYVLTGICIVCLIALQFYYPFHINDCSSDGEHFVKTGVVRSVEFCGSFNLIEFEGGGELYLHGSPNEAYDLYVIDGLLAVGVSYTFSYHHECVMSDGDDIVYFEGNIIDNIKVNP